MQVDNLMRVANFYALAGNIVKYPKYSRYLIVVREASCFDHLRKNSHKYSQSTGNDTNNKAGRKKDREV